MDYNQIKAEAKEQGISIKDLCALSPGNDPFYTGRPSEIAQAEWFQAQWNDLGFSSGVHLRRMHYALVSQDPPIPRHDGRSYENTQRCWDYLCSAGKYARYLNLISPDQFIDKRNFAPEVFYDPYASWPKIKTAISGMYEVESIGLPDCPDAPDYDLTGISGWDIDGQPYMLEIWVEKTTMHDVILPLAKQYNINVVAGKGELSISTVREFLKRAKKKGRPVRILYVADFDPAGLGMPISIARKIEFFLSVDSEYADLDIRLHPVVLTPDQIAEYSLPRVPVKDSDKRKASFELAHGAGQVELDALEALRPGELARILEDAILQYFDMDLADRLQGVHDEYKERLTLKRNNLLEAYPEIKGLQERYSRLADNFETEIADLQADMEEIWEEFSSQLETDLAFINEPDVPAAELDTEPDGQLYQSDRDYHDQLASYKAWREGS